MNNKQKVAIIMVRSYLMNQGSNIPKFRFRCLATLEWLGVTARWEVKKVHRVIQAFSTRKIPNSKPLGFQKDLPLYPWQKAAMRYFCRHTPESYSITYPYTFEVVHQRKPSKKEQQEYFAYLI